MRLSIKGMAIGAALLWGGAILFVGLINIALPTYAKGVPLYNAVGIELLFK